MAVGCTPIATAIDMTVWASVTTVVAGLYMGWRGAMTNE